MLFAKTSDALHLACRPLFANFCPGLISLPKYKRVTVNQLAENIREKSSLIRIYQTQKKFGRNQCKV